MADAVTSQKLADGVSKVVYKFTNISDGTGEAAVTKVTASGLRAGARGETCSGLVIERIIAHTAGMGVDILWDATADVLAYHIPTDQMVDLDLREFGGIPNNAGSGVTQNIQFTTVGHSAGDRYSIILEMRKKYD